MQNVKTNLKDKSINFFFPIAFILSIVPLIVRMKRINVDSTLSDMYGSTSLTDLFSQRKALFLIIFSVLLIALSIIFFKKIFSKKDKIVNITIIASVIFIFFTLLSSVFSKYREVAFWGMYDRAEGFVTITCYIIIFIYSIYAFKETTNYKYVVIPILILVAVNSFLGLFQYIGQDLIKTDLGVAIVAPSDYDVTPKSLSLLYEAGKLYGTLFHYDYVGSFAAIVLPILFCVAISEDYDITYKILTAIGTLLSIWLLLGSTSRAGLIGVIVSIILGLIIFGKLVSKKKKPLLICLTSIILITIIINFATGGSIFKKIPSLVSDASSVIKNTNDFDYKEHTPIKDIQNTDSGVNIVFQKDMLKVNYENSAYVFRNSNNDIVEFHRDDKVYTTTDKNFTNTSIQYLKLNSKSTRADAFILNINNKPEFMFNLKENNTIHLISFNSKKDIDLDFAPSLGFNGKEKLGSARGYIWSRCLPLLKDNLILGSGPDTFIYRFPQNDLIAKYYAYDNPNTIVDKPHNLYLQIALNQGIIALLAFLAIIIIYIIDSFKLYALKDEYEKDQILGAATCLGVVGYLFAGIFNDSVISVAPVFWIVLGVGVAINFINRQKLKKNF